MLEILPLFGVGPIRFGMRPHEVRAIYGNDLQYEEWMGGNLEDFLFYKGILIGFDGENTTGPTETSTVVLCEVRCDQPIQLCSELVNDLSQSTMLKLLQSNGAKHERTSSCVVRVPAFGLQLTFGPNDQLQSIYAQKVPG